MIHVLIRKLPCLLLLFVLRHAAAQLASEENLPLTEGLYLKFDDYINNRPVDPALIIAAPEASGVRF